MEELLAGGAIEWQRPPDVNGLALRKAPVSSADVLEAGGHDANDGERRSAQADKASDNRAIGVEAIVRQTASLMIATLALARSSDQVNARPMRRAHSQHVEVVARDHQALQPLRPIVDCQLKISRVKPAMPRSGPGLVAGTQQ